ncbi:AP-2 complex subunit alpha-2-like [Salvia hispanica]|uniref:AP-2 complex subunit alpha-2-like n=1 Tax=Salvia hispanica TaxID=49212 RepID=UPI00200948F3|nr:AP-2 complex subunit alpha-2-like [Salvia hispanica]
MELHISHLTTQSLFLALRIHTSAAEYHRKAANSDHFSARNLIEICELIDVGSGELLDLRDGAFRHGGLSVFISDIRNCQNKELERLRVDKELGNIRTRFKHERQASDALLSVSTGVALLSMELDESINDNVLMALVSPHLCSLWKPPFGKRGLSPYEKKKYVWKMLYIYMLGYDVDFGHMEAVGYIVTSCLLNENHDFLRLAINTVRNDIIGRNETFQCLALTLVGNIGGREFADLWLLMFKNYLSDRMAQLLDERDLGVLTSSMSLLVALVSTTMRRTGVVYQNVLRPWKDLLEIRIFHKNTLIMVKTMRALQYFPTVEDPNTRRSLFEVMHLDAEKEMMSQCVALLGKFIAVREPNIRYLGLENMTRMLMVTDVQDIIKRHQAQIITSLKDPDISIRGRALDLLYGMCDVSNAKDIVEELLQYLSTADFAMREELSLKAAILAEKFAPDLSCFIDKAGDFVSDDIWFRVVQFVTNNEDLQPYAAMKAETTAVEYLALSMKGAALMDILAEMPKFPERQSSLIRKAEDSEADTAEQSAIKLRAQQHTSNALVLTDQPLQWDPTCTPAWSCEGAYHEYTVRYHSVDSDWTHFLNESFEYVSNKQICGRTESTSGQGLAMKNGTLAVVDPQPPSTPSPDLLGDLLGPLAIEGPPGTAPQSDPSDSGVLYEDVNIQIGIKADWRGHQGRVILFLGNKNTAPLVSVQALILPPSHLKTELSLVQCPLEVVNLQPSRDSAVLDFSYKFGANLVNVKLRLPLS